MNTPNQDPLQDNFEVEISDLSPDQADAPDGPAPSSRRAGQTRLSPRARARRVALVASALLLLVVALLGSQPAMRSQVVGLVQRLIPTPTPTLAPGADRFYLATDVPWATVALDGQPIAPPRISVDAPLHLARGHHLLTWDAAPFLPQQCSIDVPPIPASSCRIINQVRQGTSGPLAFVISLPESLDTLPAAPQQALIKATRIALSGFSDTVQPGERYLIDSAGNVFGDDITRQPLRATFQLQLDTELPSDTCSLNRRNVPPSLCAVAGRDCARFCALPWQLRQADTDTTGKLEWQVLAVIYPPTWDYATQDGKSITQFQPICHCGAASSESPVLLHIAWDGLAWHVQPLFGPNLGPPLVLDGITVAADPACLVAEDIFPRDIQTYTRLRFVAGPNPAVGCLLQATLATPQGTPAAAAPVEEYLTRFGELLAVNDLAHQRFPQWPQANASEQQIASQLAALPGGLIVTGD
jgi:hypothetical protein